MIDAGLPRNPLMLQLRLKDHTWLQSANACIECFWGRDISERREIINCLRIWALINPGKIEQSWNLTSECKSIIFGRIEERFDTKPIPHENQRLCSFIVDGQCKHSPQLLNKFTSFFFIEVRNNLRIRSSPKLMSSRFKIHTEVVVVIKFAIKHNPH